MQDVINFNLLKEYDTTLKDVLQVWTKQKAYSLGDKVRYKGHLLECTTAGTSGTTTLNFTNLDIGYTINDGTVVWELVEEESGKGIDFYTVGESYKVGDIVIYSGNIYQCITAHTATSTFDTTKWEEVSKSGIPYYNQDTSYKVDDQVVYNNKIYKCKTAHTSTSTFDSTKWEELSSGGGISIWQANTAYNVNDVVIDSNLIWQCATAHTSASTFDESKWICISGGEISNGMEIVPLWEGSFSFSNSTQGATPTSSTPMIELSEPISNFEYILVCGALDSDLTNADSVIVPISAINPPSTIRFSIVIDNNDYYTASINQYDSTHLYIAWKVETYAQTRITKVQGIRKAKPIVSSGMKYETLWEGEAGVINSEGTTTVSLSSPYSGYKKLGITVNYRDGSSYVTKYHEFDSRGITTTSRLFSCFGYDNSDYNIDNLKAIGSTTLSFSYNNAVITKIIGISEGVQIPTGVQAARVTLFEGTKLGNDSSDSLLLDNINNYDVLEIESWWAWDASGVDRNAHKLSYANVATILANPTKYTRVSNYMDNTYHYSMEIKFPYNTYFKIDGMSLSSSLPMCCITKIVGIKYIQPDSYSTQEKLIGTWIDGKPLYRKVFTNVSDGYSTGLTFSSYTIIKYYGMINISGYSIIIPQPYENGARITLFINSDGTVSLLNSAMGTPHPMSYMAVEYTKN